MSERKYIIYQITNLLNDMIYVGKHSTTTPYDMKNYWGSSDWLKSSIEIYGKENFKRETLFVFETEDEAYQKEREIVTPEFVAREDTYNICVGGWGTGSGENHPLYGKHHSEETKQRMSENHWDNSGEEHPFYGKHHSKETKQRMSEAQKGEKNHNWGKHHTEKTKRKISANRSNTGGKEHYNWGKHHTEKTRKKMSESLKGRIFSKEHRKKIGDSHRGKVLSEEHKCKLSEAKGLTLEIIEKRRKDIEEIPKIWGWKTRLKEKWGIKSPTTVTNFLKKHASDLVSI